MTKKVYKRPCPEIKTYHSHQAGGVWGFSTSKEWNGTPVATQDYVRGEVQINELRLGILGLSFQIYDSTLLEPFLTRTGNVVNGKHPLGYLNDDCPLPTRNLRIVLPETNGCFLVINKYRRIVSLQLQGGTTAQDLQGKIFNLEIVNFYDVGCP